MHNAVCESRFRSAQSQNVQRWYDFHTSFGKRVAFYQEVPQYRHMGGGGGRHTCAPFEFSPPTFSSVYASNPSLLSGWFMERRGLFHPWEIGITAKVLDVGVAKWFDEISIRSREYSSLFLCFEDRWDRCCIRRWMKLLGRKRDGDIFERSVNLFLECKNGKYQVYRDISFWIVFETTGSDFFLDVLVGNFWWDLWKVRNRCLINYKNIVCCTF